MATRKQEILNEMLYMGLLDLRNITGWGYRAGWRFRLFHRDEFGRGWNESDFLHRIRWSILEPEFNKNDLSFINEAFPNYIKRMGRSLDNRRARLMIEFFELVPEELHSKLTWKPPDSLRDLAGKNLETAARSNI